MQIRSHRQAEYGIRREKLSQGHSRGVFRQLDRFLVAESRKKGLVVDPATSPTALVYSEWFLCQPTQMEEPITRRAEARTSCWDVPNDTGSHAVSCGGPRQYVCHMPSLCLGCSLVARHGRTKISSCRLRANRVLFNLTRRLLLAGGDPRTASWQSDAVDRGHRKPDPRARPSRARAANEVGT